MTATIRYGFKICGDFIPSGTEVQILDSHNHKLKEHFPNLIEKPDSKIVAIEYSHAEKHKVIITLVHESDLII